MLNSWKSGESDASTVVYRNLQKIRMDASTASLQALREGAKANKEAHNAWASRLAAFQSGDKNAMRQLLMDSNR